MVSFLQFYRFKKTMAIALISCFFQMLSFAQGDPATTGSGYCLDFTANIAKGNYVDLGSLMAIDTGNFSIEMWVNVNACKNDPAFFSNKDWSSGNNTGIVFDVHDNGTKLRVNLKPSNSNFQNFIIPINAIGRGWFHLAVTLDRNSFFKIYIDGILKSSTYMQTPQTQLNGSFASAYTYKLGQDGTGIYSDNNNVPIPYDGKLDEIRIWKRELQQDEIREHMCKKRSPISVDLYAYYDCNSLAGDSVKNLKGGKSGNWVNAIASNWKVSGAAIGDTSTVLYPDSQDWNGKELTLRDSTYGNLKIKNVLAVEGIHLYKINSAPNFINGAKPFLGNTAYYGVFLAGTSNGTTYDAILDYSKYPTNATDEGYLKLFERNQNSDHIWSDYVAKQNTTLNIFPKSHEKWRREYILGTRKGISCNAEDAVEMVSNTSTTSTLKWSGGSASRYIISWAKQGFELGQGNMLENMSTNPYTFVGLEPGVYYDLYIKDTCDNSIASQWAGPFVFYPESCMSPTNYTVSNVTDKSVLLTWKGNKYKTDIEWGLLGFVLGQGIPDSTFTDSLLLTGLSPNTSYSYYVKANCPSGSNTTYDGPFTFKTSGKNGVDENELSRSISIYPNPSSGEFTMQVNTDKKITMHVYNILGKEIFKPLESAKSATIKQVIDLKNFPAGIYLISVNDGKDMATKSIIIQ